METLTTKVNYLGRVFEVTLKDASKWLNDNEHDTEKKYCLASISFAGVQIADLLSREITAKLFDMAERQLMLEVAA